MKNLKSFLVYGTIIVLGIISIAGYIVSKKPAGTGVAGDIAINTAAPKDKELQQGSSLPDKVLEKVKKAALITDSTPIVGVGRGDDYGKVVREAVENAGELKNLIKKGDTVLIKPNLINGFPAGSAMCTDHRIIQQIADIAKEYGAERVIVAEASMSGNVFKAAEYDKITGVELIDMNQYDKADCYEIKPEKSLTGKALFIPKIYMDADVVICAAKLKTHFQPDAVVSLSLKNSFGVPSNKIYNNIGYKNILHAIGDLKDVIVDINRIRKPDFVVIDGIVAGEGNGPLNNTPVNANTVFAGSDPVAVDTAALTFMGFTVEEVPHVKLAGEEGLGISDIAKIKVQGAVLDEIKMKFKKP
ncbi:MAG: DUF362 domain-containing protein [Bacillota bacterium]